MVFKDATQAEILRASQKDSFIISKLKSEISEIAQKLLGTRRWLNWYQEVQLLSELIYFGVTTLKGYQTLGEEYVNIIQVDSSKRHLPSKLRQMLMIILQVTGPYLSVKGITWLQKNFLSHPSSRHLSPQMRNRLQIVLPKLQQIMLFFHNFHLMTFYLGGAFYHLAKRVTGVRYILLRNWLANRTAKPYFLILGLLSLLQLVIGLSLLLWSHYKEFQSLDQETVSNGINFKDCSDSSVSVEPNERCPLCLGKRRNSTVTPCGHLYCWRCIFECIQIKAQCPMCREDIEPSRLVCLQNYDDNASE